MNWRMASFNVNGIRARVAAVVDWMVRRQPNALCLQEIKCQEKDFPFSPFQDLGYQIALRGQKSFNGVAILTRNPAEEVLRNFDDDQADEEARLIAVKVDGIWLVNTYIPQGRHPDDPAFGYKLQYFKRLRNWFENRFHPDQAIIWTGDMNVAPAELDVFDPKSLEGSVCFHPLARSALSDVVSWGFVDLFRWHHPEAKQFTFWDYRLPKSFERNLGWRLDHIMVTRPMAERSLNCVVDGEMRGRETPSDHAPIWAEFAF